MEIFQAFGVDWRLLLIQAVNFALLLLALHFFLYKPVLSLIDERRARIEKGVRDAAEAERRLRSADEEKTSILAAATREAEAFGEEARRTLSEEERLARVAAEEKAERILESARKESQDLKNQAVSGAEKDIARMVVLGIEKTLKSKSN